jgi:hypothetical protein
MIVIHAALIVDDHMSVTDRSNVRLIAVIMMLLIIALASARWRIERRLST